MKAALAAIHATRGHTWPNPTVGCVLVDPATDAVIASASTSKGGRPHAEMSALQLAGPRARGCHAYVTLEPCNHETPAKPCSCTRGLLEAGIAAVFIALPDPDPRMMGHSIAQLRGAGVAVHVGLCARDAYHAIRGHMTRLEHARPYITLKLAHSRDGYLGLPATRTPVSCDASWQRTYIQRGKVDAVMVGIGTALADDPKLTDRRHGPQHQPVRVVLDTRRRLPLVSALVQTARETPVWLVTQSEDASAHEAAGVRILRVQNTRDLHAVMAALYEAGLGHVLCEGGAMLAKALLADGMVDEALMIEGVSELGANGIPCPRMPQNMRLRTTETIGVDTWRIYDSEMSLKSETAFYDAARVLESGMM